MIARAIVGLVVALTLVPTATTLAAWADTSAVTGTASTAAVVVARPLQCAGGAALSKDVTWAAFTNHPLEGTDFYEVTVNGIKVTPVKTGTTYGVTVSLGLGNLLGPVLVSVTAWPRSVWAKTSTITLERAVLGLSLGFSCP